MTGLAYQDFEHRAGTAYRVVPVPISGEVEPVTLTLRICAPLNDSGREGGSFRLEFTGPAQPHLPQAIYAFEAAGEPPIEIFIVPVAAQAAALIYEAVFF